jgi:hypothetical protein
MFNDVKKRYDNTQLHVWGCASVRSHGHHIVQYNTNKEVVQLVQYLCYVLLQGGKHNLLMVEEAEEFFWGVGLHSAEWCWFERRRVRRTEAAYEVETESRTCQ